MMQRNARRKLSRKTEPRKSWPLHLLLPKGKRKKKSSIFRLKKLLGRARLRKMMQLEKMSIRKERMQNTLSIRISKITSKLYLSMAS